MGDNSGDKARATSTRTAAGRRWIFAYDVAALVAVMAIGAYYVVAQPSLGAATANQVLAIESMWFGAIGGLMISLKGVYDHRDGASGWDSGFALWHIGRPFSGAVAGAVTALLLSVVDGGKTAAPTVVYAAAFIFGTQERRFFGFLSEIARLVVQVPDEAKQGGLAATDVQPSAAAPGTVVVVRGHGMAADATVKLGATAIDKLTVADDGSYAAGLVPVRPMGADVVDVVVANPNGASFVLPGRFRYTS